MKYSLLILLFITQIAGAQFNPDAGRIASHTEKAVVRVSSGVNANMATDNNHHTYWESAHALPEGYIGRDYLNRFHLKHPNRLIQLSGPAFDGDLNSMQQFSNRQPNGKYVLNIPFSEASLLQLLSIKAQLTSSLRITLFTRNASVFAGFVQPADNYKLISLKVSETYRFESLLIECDAPFALFELAALTEPPYEFVAFDFGGKKEVQQIWTRHMSGENVRAVRIERSDNGKDWQALTSLNPQAIPFMPLMLSEPVQTRHLRIRFDLSADNYGKALLWEIKIFDRHGPFGPPIQFVSNRMPLRERIGINGIWGWGFNTYSDNIPEGSGPAMFAPVATHGRNYHELLWDISAPGERAGYEKMTGGKGTQASWWLDWDREYAAWRSAGILPTASIQFKNKTVAEKLWSQPSQQAYQYGFDFAKHFGPASGRNLLDMVEIGNEPWDYSSGFYRQILTHMLRGMKAADQDIRVVPAALQASFRQFEGHDYNNYAGENLSAEILSMADGLNGHFYAHMYNNDGVRISTFPENPLNELHASRNLIRFRDANAKGKAVYVTEFGYDSQGGGENCTHPECVSEAQQAAWGIRAAILLLRNGIERAYWYFFANEFTDSFLHSRSGLTGSLNTGFEKKQSYFAFQQLQSILGNSFLSRIIEENSTYYCYLFENDQQKKFALVWRPIGGDPSREQILGIDLDAKAARYFVLNGKPNSNWKELSGGRKIVIPVSGFPTVIALE